MTAMPVPSPARPSWRGTMRNPGANLAHLPIGLDLHAINVVEGMRAAVAIVAIVVLNDWLGWPPLTAALAAYLTCFCDPGGPVARRLPPLLAFVLLGALTWMLFGLLRQAGIAVVPLAGVAIFCNSFARVWGLPAAVVGNILTIVVVLALDAPLNLPAAAGVGGMFIAGGLWAVLLTMVIWRLHPYQPVQHAVAELWRLLAAMTADMYALARRDETSTADWEAHARANRRAVRDAIELARGMIMDTVRARDPASPRASQALIQLETADQLFGALIALSELLEYAPPGGARQLAGRRLLRVLRPMLVVLYHAMQIGRIERLPRLDRVISNSLDDAGADPALHGLAATIADRLHIAVKLATTDGQLPDQTGSGGAVLALRERILGPIRANLTWESAILRHAVRAAVVGALVLAATVIYPAPLQHWLTITVVLTMQPFFMATWQRALERIAGTLLGAAVGAGLVLFAHSPLALAALMFPLCMIGFSMRQVSYGAFIACLTPALVVFVEVAEPGTSQWTIAGMRALYSIGGGLIAVLASLLLWPSWEPDRLWRELHAAIAAHGRYAGATLSAILGEADEAQVERTRHAAGMASNNLEASLSRALQEPRRKGRDRLEAALVADATLRRIAGRLTVLQHDPTERAHLDAPTWRRWRGWLTGALSERRDAAATRPDLPRSDALARIARQVELLDGTLRRVRPEAENGADNAAGFARGPG
jgi:uncharacterized membrane protein YccC